MRAGFLQKTYVISSTLVVIIFITVSGRVWPSDVPAYIAGAYTNLLIHEMGHVSVAKWYDASDIRVEIPRKNAGIYSGATYYTPDSIESRTPEFMRSISIAGLVSANLAGEIVISNNDLYDDTYFQGTLSTTQLSNISTVFRYYTGTRYADGRGNDIDSFEAAGG